MRLAFLCAAFTALSTSCAQASILKPAVLPLFVRNPYLSTWLGNAREAPWTSWPTFWTGQDVGLGAMLHLAKYDTVYPLLGKPQDGLDIDDNYTIKYPYYNGASFDGSTTNLSYSIVAGQEELNVVLSFVSPVTVNDTMRQSIPAGYLKVYLEGNIDASIYVDVNGMWVSGDRGSQIEWSFTETDVLKTFQVKRQVEATYTEYNDRAEWGRMFFSASKDAHHEAGTSNILRQRFSTKGRLDDHVDGEFRTIMDEEPVFAFSKHFKLSSNHTTTNQNTTMVATTLFTIAHLQDPVIQYASARGMTNMRPLWLSYFASAFELLHFHYLDFEKVAHIAAKLTEQILNDATRALTKKQGEVYAEILLLSARQVIGGTSFAGTPTNPLIFLKEISSDGNTQTIDVIFPAFPFFLYANPSWLRYLLEPLLEHQSAGLYPNDYSMHDIGTHFPNATGHPDGFDEYMPVEECGNMLIMGASAAGNIIEEYGGGEAGRKKAKEWIEGAWGDGGYIRDRYALWKKWTGYLIKFGLLPATQLSTDDFAGQLANQTNLALKGIIGIKAMSQIAAVVGKSEDEKYFSDVADKYIAEWENLAISRDGTHTKLAYHWHGSWGTLYNLYADSLLCYRSTTPSNSLAAFSTIPKLTNKTAKPSFVPSKIYRIQSKYYSSVLQQYGLPLDSRHIYTKSDWEFFAAAVSDRKTRGKIVEAVGRWVSETGTDRPMTDLYDAESGNWPGINFMARPVVGGHFAVLALEKACGGKGLDGLGYDGKEGIFAEEEDGVEKVTGNEHEHALQIRLGGHDDI